MVRRLYLPSRSLLFLPQKSNLFANVYIICHAWQRVSRKENTKKIDGGRAYLTTQDSYERGQDAE